MSKPLSPAQLEARRKGGRARAKQFDYQHQRAALEARNRRYGDYHLRLWGYKGYYTVLKNSGFSTNYIEHLQLKLESAGLL